LVYDASVRLWLATIFILTGTIGFLPAAAQDRDLSKPDSSKAEPKYDDTYSGSIVEFATNRVTVSRSILGKSPEKRVFAITSDTRVEGKLRVKLKVTVGFISTDDGDVARLIVVRQKPPDKK
jgi:hypothetical protein